MKYDNFYIQDLSIVLTKETSTEKVSSLIQYVAEIISFCENNKLLTRDDVLQNKDIFNMISIPSEMVEFFYRYLNFFRFRSVSLNKLPAIGEDIISELKSMNIKNTLNVLNNIDKLKHPRFDKAIAMSKLGRIIAVRNIRASLYYDSGYKCVKDIALTSYDEFIESINTYIANNSDSRICPLKKEALTTLAWAEVLHNYDIKQLRRN